MGAREDEELVIWALSSVELLSALPRVERSSRGLDLLSDVRRDALDLVGAARPVGLVDAVRQRTEPLVGVHATSPRSS